MSCGFVHCRFVCFVFYFVDEETSLSTREKSHFNWCQSNEQLWTTVSTTSWKSIQNTPILLDIAQNLSPESILLEQISISNNNQLAFCSGNGHIQTFRVCRKPNTLRSNSGQNYQIIFTSLEGVHGGDGNFWILNHSGNRIALGSIEGDNSDGRFRLFDRGLIVIRVNCLLWIVWFMYIRRTGRMKCKFRKKTANYGNFTLVAERIYLWMLFSSCTQFQKIIKLDDMHAPIWYKTRTYLHVGFPAIRRE